VDRNGLGQITKVTQHGGQGPLVLQQVSYDALHRLSMVSRPGHGATALAYHPTTGLLNKVTAPDGVVMQVSAFDPLTDRPNSLVTERKTTGASATQGGVAEVFTQYFGYDGMERYASRWNSVVPSSASAPLESVRYHFPTATTLGAVEASELVDATTKVHRSGASLVSAAGDAMASLSRIPQGWAVSSLASKHRQLAEVRGYRRGPLAATAKPGALTRIALIPTGTAPISTARSAGFGHATHSQQILQQGVSRSEATAVSLVLDPQTGAARQLTTSTENGAYATQAARDMNGNLVWSTDQKGTKTAFIHDALGRLVSVTLPDKARHWRRFDSYGRLASVSRDRVGSVTLAYHATTGKLTRKTFKDSAGKVVRSVTPSYDSIGRLTKRVQTDATTQKSRVVSFTYDGALGAPVAGQRGRLTQVSADGYRRTEIYNPDGTLKQRRVRVGDWMEVSWDHAYHADGSMRRTSRVVRRVSTGAVVQKDSWDAEHDAWGRPHKELHNSQMLTELAYDTEGRVHKASLAGNASLTFHYDSVTRSRKGYALDAGAWKSGVDWQLNARGLVNSENLTFGTQQLKRSYGYDARGFLQTQTDGLVAPQP
jgi:YD repeat-containing protein